METYEWYIEFFLYTTAAIVVVLAIYRMVIMHKYYIERGEWSSEVDIKGGLFDINSTNLALGVLSSIIILTLYTLTLLFIGLFIDYTMVMLCVVAVAIILSAVIGAYIYLTKRERNKKLFYDKLSGEG